MTLYHIKALFCPSCGARAVREEQNHQHCNGEFNELRTFECGCVLRWTPNFSPNGLSTDTKCPQTPDCQGALRKREKAITQLEEFLDKLDTDTVFKEHIKERGWKYWSKLSTWPPL